MPLPSISGGGLQQQQQQQKVVPATDVSVQLPRRQSTVSALTSVKPTVPTGSNSNATDTVNASKGNQDVKPGRKASVAVTASTTPIGRKSSVMSKGKSATPVETPITKKLVRKQTFKRREGVVLEDQLQQQQQQQSIQEDEETEDVINNDEVFKASLSPYKLSEYLLSTSKSATTTKVKSLDSTRSLSLDNTSKSSLNATSNSNMELLLPLGLRIRELPPMGEVSSNDRNSIQDYLNSTNKKVIDERLQGLPGNLSMDSKCLNTYFGNNGRDNFFERCQWMHHQRQIHILTATETTSSLYFDNEQAIARDLAKLIPFGATRDDKSIMQNRLGQMSKQSLINDTIMIANSSIRSNQYSLDNSEYAASDAFDTRRNSSSINSDYSNSVSIDTLEMHLSSPRFDGLDFETPNTPRTAYIDACAANSVNPLPMLIIRSNLTKVLDLKHLGIGDQRAAILAASLAKLPYLESINLEDNNLTDSGLGPILHSIVSIPGLLEINLSQNEIGPDTATALFNYLIDKSCPLERLVLRHADVDDYECDRFIDAVKRNSSLKTLILSNNKIGLAENLNTVMPDLTTGGEALANLLRLSTCKLETLILDWNSIRLDGAIDLASSLAVNSSLTHLDLSFNAMGQAGGIAVGVALHDNRTLKVLNLSSNNIDACATFAICASILCNHTIKSLILDGNPIAEQGAKVLMMMPLLVGTRVGISAVGCNITIKDAHCWFDHHRPLREYELDMSNGFERAVAILLLNIVASHHTYIFESVSLQEKPSSKRVPIELVSVFSDEKKDYFDEATKNHYESLLRIVAASNDIKYAVRLFQETDEDNSGELNKDEINLLLKNMGMDLTEERLNDIFTTYDTDGGGMIELPEFLTFLRVSTVESTARAKDLVEAPIMKLKSSDAIKPWIPPTYGKLHMKIVDGFSTKDVYRTMSSADKNKMHDCAKGAGSDTLKMMFHAIEASRLRLDEGVAMFKIMISESTDRVKVLAKILPQMASPFDVRQLLATTIGKDRMEMLRLKREMGSSMRPLIGFPNGYYVLDMGNVMDRFCVNRLIENSRTYAAKKKASCPLGLGIIGDYSQKGNWSNFRNELHNGKPVVVDANFATPLPRSGKLEFDFSGTVRPSKDDLIATDIRVIKCLLNHYLIEENETLATSKYLKKMANATLKTLDCDGMTLNKCELSKALKISEHMNVFYENLYQRCDIYESSLLRDNSTRVASAIGVKASVKGTRGTATDGNNDNDDTLDNESVSLVGSLLVEDIDSNSDNSDSDDDNDDSASMSTKSSKVTGILYTRHHDDFTHKLGLLMNSNVSDDAKSRKLIDCLEESLGRMWILSRHLALLVSLFKKVGYKKSTEYYGTHRVDLIVLMFGAVVDLHNFDIVLKELDAYETACLYCRIGLLNIYNPCKPEGSWELDLSRREERLVVKTLCLLATNEPGDNWTTQIFKWQRDMDPMPGWELTQPWLTDEGMPVRGILTITYYSGENKGLRGCKPSVPYRKSLLNAVLIDEWEVVEDGFRDRPVTKQLIGRRALEANKSIWINYLALKDPSQKKKL